jgi:hypothetical protein
LNKKNKITIYSKPSIDKILNFFEKIRTKRNGINYYSSKVSEKDWKEVKIQLIYTSILLRKRLIKK